MPKKKLLNKKEKTNEKESPAGTQEGFKQNFERNCIPHDHFSEKG